MPEHLGYGPPGGVSSAHSSPYLLLVLCACALGAPPAVAIRGSSCPSALRPPLLRSDLPHRFGRETESFRAGSTSVLALVGLRGGGAEQEESVGEEIDPCIIDLTGDQGVLKLTTRAGIEGLRPVEKDEVYLLFNGSIECLDNQSTVFNGKNISGVQFDSSMVGPGATLPRSFQVGSGNTITGWDLAVRNMSKRERATVLIRSDFAYGTMGRTTRGGVFIPPNSTLRFELELLRWNEKDLYNDGGVVVSDSKTEEAQRPDSDNHPEETDQVLLRYTGRYNGQVFLSSGPTPVWVALSQFPWPQKAGETLLPPSTLPRGIHTVLTKEAIKGGHYNMTLTSAYAYGAEGRPADAEGGVHVPPNASVDFDVQLLDWNTLTDRYLDGSLIIKCHGQPEDYFASACRDSAKANLEITGVTSNGTVFLSSTNFTEIVIGNRVLPAALEAGISVLLCICMYVHICMCMHG
jgi:FKBP-type peptidyl-prolyl cis-trans isomerase